MPVDRSSFAVVASLGPALNGRADVVVVDKEAVGDDDDDNDDDDDDDDEDDVADVVVTLHTLPLPHVQGLATAEQSMQGFSETLHNLAVLIIGKGGATK
jgi:hypothetical protein